MEVFETGRGRVPAGKRATRPRAARYGARHMVADASQPRAAELALGMLAALLFSGIAPALLAALVESLLAPVPSRVVLAGTCSLLAVGAARLRRAL